MVMAGYYSSEANANKNSTRYVLENLYYLGYNIFKFTIINLQRRSFHGTTKKTKEQSKDQIWP